MDTLILDLLVEEARKKTTDGLKDYSDEFKADAVALHTYEVKRLCHVLNMNRSSYYKWRAGAEARAARQREDLILAEEIVSILEPKNS